MTQILLILTIVLNPADDAALDQHVMALSRQLRCLVCQNETIADSHADLATDLRRQIREQMKAGRSDAEITMFLTDRYGDFIRYRPTVKPRTYALWFGPFVLLAGALFGLYCFLKRWPAAVKRQGRLSEEEHRRAKTILSLGKNPNAEIYRAQLAEMESELLVGRIDRQEFEQDREDIERRILDDCKVGTSRLRAAP